jgi:hypothetical protein
MEDLRALIDKQLKCWHKWKSIGTDPTMYYPSPRKECKKCGLIKNC